MSRESEVADILRANAPLMALLTGGIYTDEEIGVEGFRRGADSPTNDAFDVKGVLLPCMAVREGDEVSMPGIRSPKEKITGVSQPIHLYLYQHRNADVITAALQITYSVLEKRRLPGTYPLDWQSDSPVFYDTGPVANSTTRRQAWRCVFLKRGA